jgi:hypothetical protein
MASAFEIKAAIPDATGYVTTPVQSLYEKTFQHDQITRILQRGRHLGLRYRLDTQPNNTSVKIYSTYRITAKLIGAFTYGFGR